MSQRTYAKGLHEVGNGVFAYLQPNGSYGFSNAGLLVEDDKSILVDTLFDLPLTREMLESMRRATPAASDIDILINTHANTDHTFGNQLVSGAEIIASASCAEEMKTDNPALLELFRNWRRHGEYGRYVHELMPSFDFEGIVITPPTRTFEERLTLSLGDRKIELMRVGPAHTKGDILIFSPSDRVVFTGDILFVGGHPVMWAGPWNNWIRACDLILSWDADVIVPGHGPITDKSGVRDLRGYLIHMRDAAKARYDAGLGLEETVRDLADYAPARDWIDADRLVININALFGEFGGRGAIKDPLELIALQRKLGLAQAPACSGEGCDHHR